MILQLSPLSIISCCLLQCGSMNSRIVTKSCCCSSSIDLLEFVVGVAACRRTIKASWSFDYRSRATSIVLDIRFLICCHELHGTRLGDLAWWIRQSWASLIMDRYGRTRIKTGFNSHWCWRTWSGRYGSLCRLEYGCTVSPTLQHLSRCSSSSQAVCSFCGSGLNGFVRQVQGTGEGGRVLWEV